MFLIKASFRGEHCKQVLVWSQINAKKWVILRRVRCILCTCLWSQGDGLRRALAPLASNSSWFRFGKRPKATSGLYCLLSSAVGVRFGKNNQKMDFLYTFHTEMSRSGFWDLGSVSIPVFITRLSSAFCCFWTSGVWCLRQSACSCASPAGIWLDWWLLALFFFFFLLSMLLFQPVWTQLSDVGKLLDIRHKPTTVEHANAWLVAHNRILQFSVLRGKNRMPLKPKHIFIIVRRVIDAAGLLMGQMCTEKPKFYNDDGDLNKTCFGQYNSWVHFSSHP